MVSVKSFKRSSACPQLYYVAEEIGRVSDDYRVFDKSLVGGFEQLAQFVYLRRHLFIRETVRIAAEKCAYISVDDGFGYFDAERHKPVDLVGIIVARRCDRVEQSTRYIRRSVLTQHVVHRSVFGILGEICVRDVFVEIVSHIRAYELEYFRRRKHYYGIEIIVIIVFCGKIHAVFSFDILRTGEYFFHVSYD